MSFPTGHTKSLLIVDDNDDDVFLLMWALKKGKYKPDAHRAANGVQAIAYLQNCLRNHEPSSQLPGLVLLDIKMPGVNGHEVLAWIRSQPALQHLSVYMLSSSALEVDVLKAEAAGADGYWVKPSDLQEHLDLALRINSLLLLASPARYHPLQLA
ncbi:MAG TPA: response regulator [Candidatus Saccharimonadales bacterium]|nr:response regulator [Candidatus Saccharimonadales bacterium]